MQSSSTTQPHRNRSLDAYDTYVTENLHAQNWEQLDYVRLPRTDLQPRWPADHPRYGQDNDFIPLDATINLIHNQFAVNYYIEAQDDFEIGGYDLLHEIHAGDIVHVRSTNRYGIRETLNVLVCLVFRTYDAVTGDRNIPKIRGVVLNEDGTFEVPAMTLYGGITRDDGINDNAIGWERRVVWDMVDIQSFLLHQLKPHGDYKGRDVEYITCTLIPTTAICKCSYCLLSFLNF
jgi:hypothetical protein